MNKKSLVKLGFAALIAVATMLGAKPSQAAGLCVFQYTHNGHLCTYAGNVNGCCVYSNSAGKPCPPICGV